MSDDSELFDPTTKKTGFAHLLAATRYSLAGCKRLLTESAFRHELILATLLIGFYLLIGAKFFYVAVAICLLLITFAIEAINTAIELVVDRTSPEISEYAKDAKDLGSFAVLCLLIANVIFAAYVVPKTLFFMDAA